MAKVKNLIITVKTDEKAEEIVDLVIKAFTTGYHAGKNNASIEQLAEEINLIKMETSKVMTIKE